MIINSFAFPAALGKQYFIPIVFVITAVMEYFVFRYLIVKLNIPTLGRENMGDEQVIEEKTSSSTNVDRAQVINIVEGLGGKENITNIMNCYTRLRVDVKDENKVNMDILKKKVKSSGIVDKGKHIQIVIGLGVTEVREAVEDYLKGE